MFFKLDELMSKNFKLINLVSMNFKLINLKLIVLLVPCILFYAFLYLWNLIVKKNNKKFKTDLITSSILITTDTLLRNFKMFLKFVNSIPPRVVKMVKHAVKIFQKLAQDFCPIIDHFGDTSQWGSKVARQYNNDTR